jgi:hypothetical protein
MAPQASEKSFSYLPIIHKSAAARATVSIQSRFLDDSPYSKTRNGS